MESESLQKAINKQVLGKSLSKQAIGIIFKIRELDQFLSAHEEYKKCYMREPSGAVFCRIERRGIAIRKSDFFGIAQRDEILSQFIKDEKIHNTYQLAKEMKCKQDDIPDADCLAVTAALKEHELTEIIPAEPQTDSRGLLMQIVVPKL